MMGERLRLGASARLISHVLEGDGESARSARSEPSKSTVASARSVGSPLAARSAGSISFAEDARTRKSADSADGWVDSALTEDAAVVEAMQTAVARASVTSADPTADTLVATYAVAVVGAASAPFETSAASVRSEEVSSAEWAADIAAHVAVPDVAVCAKVSLRADAA
jgi:hypothetical protein